MGVAGSPLPGSALATGIRKSFNPGYLGAQGPPNVLAQGPGPGYPLQEVLHPNSAQQPPGWPPHQPPSSPLANSPYPVFRSAAGGSLSAMGMRGESLARAQHGLMMPGAPEGPGGGAGGMYYGPGPPSAMIGPGGARLVPGRGPGDSGPGHLAPGRAMYLSRQQPGPPYMEQFHPGGPGSPGLPVMVEGRQPPGYQSPGELSTLYLDPPPSSP
jgi:hypothetical protein